MKKVYTLLLLAALLLPICAVAQGSTFTIERKYQVHWANQNSMPSFSIEFNNGKLITVRYLKHSYGKEFGLWVNIGETGNNNGTKYALWKLGSVTTDQWVNEKIEIETDGTIRYYQNGTLLKSDKFAQFQLDNAKSFTMSFGTYGWYTGHYHYMDDLKVSVGGQPLVTDNFSSFNNNLWQQPKNPDGVRVDGGIMKMEQKRTDQDFSLHSKPINIESLGEYNFDGGAVSPNGIAVEYRDTKLLDNEPDYKLYEDQLNIGINGYTLCEATHKMYFLDGISTVVEYDYSNAMNKQVARRSFQLPFAVEMKGSIIEVSPNGMYLASVDEDGAALHIISIASGREIATAPLGEKYKNIIKSNGKDVSWHPFHFISDNEVLVAGTANALLYNIAKKKGKKLSFKKPYNQTPKYVVNPSGRISGFTTTSPLQFVTFQVTNGKMSDPIPDIYYYGATAGMYCIYKNNSWSDWTLHDEKTGARVDNQLRDSDRAKYKFNWNNDRKRYELQTLGNPQVQVHFPNMQWFEWIDDHKLLVIWTTDRKVQLFNHTLTGNEMEKQQIMAIADKGSVAAFDNYISEYPNSRYISIAKQKRTEYIESMWQKVSKPTEYTASHAKAVKKYIDNYGNEVNVNAARTELENIYKHALNNIGRSDIDGFNQYIQDFPQSPYLSQAQKKLNDAYRYKYEELRQTNDLQAYADYCNNYPESPYIEALKERGRVIYQRQQEEEQRIKEEEEQRRIEEMRQRNAAKLNSVGKRIYWYETATYKINNDDGLLMSIFKSATGLDKLDEVKYNVRYTAIVEAIIGETSVKCVISNVQIEDPSWASANYLKYKKYAISDVQENLGRTRVLQLDEFEL